MNTTAIQAWKQQEDEARVKLDFLQNKFALVSNNAFYLKERLDKNARQTLSKKEYLKSDRSFKGETTNALIQFDLDLLEIELKGMASAMKKMTALKEQVRAEVDKQTKAVESAAELTQIAIEESQEGDYQITVFKNAGEAVN